RGFAGLAGEQSLNPRVDLMRTERCWRHKREPVHPMARYTALSGLLLVTACGVCVLGLSLAGESFAPVPSPSASETETIASVRATQACPQSALLGSDPQRVAREAEARQSWVEVVDAVNMRQGPSSANAVIRVQLAGTKLRV